MLCVSYTSRYLGGGEYMIMKYVRPFGLRLTVSGPCGRACPQHPIYGPAPANLFCNANAVATPFSGLVGP